MLGTERHESRRIDNQLRGRSGRQGDPGESKFYLSLGDDLMRLFNAGAVERIMTTLNLPDDVPIESKMVSRAIRSAQSQVESQNFEIRKNVLKYDEVLNRQREVIYDERRQILNGEDLHEQVQSMLEDVVTSYVAGATAEGYAEDWDLEQLWTALGTLFPVSLSLAEIDADRGAVSAEYLTEELLADAKAAYAKREADLGVDMAEVPLMRDLERRVLLSVLDRKWREHLYEMDYLQEGIGLRAMAQRDPLVEYQREGFSMFQAMMEGIKEEAVGFLFNVEVQLQQPEAAPVLTPDLGALAAVQESLGAATATADDVPADDAPAADGEPAAAPEGPHVEPVLPRGFGPQRQTQLQYSAPTIDGDEHVTRSTGPADAAAADTARNAPCPCGSGKKYKRCHGAPGAQPL